MDFRREEAGSSTGYQTHRLQREPVAYKAILPVFNVSNTRTVAPDSHGNLAIPVDVPTTGLANLGIVHGHHPLDKRAVRLQHLAPALITLAKQYRQLAIQDRAASQSLAPFLGRRLICTETR